MRELAFRVEWDEAPGVTDPDLARTWAQIQILVGGTPVTRFYSSRSQSVRSGIYGSALPLAAWLVDHWWFLLCEGTPSSRIFEGGRRALAQDDDGELRDWLQRHNLLSAREGFALPDLSIFRDESGVQLRWVPDPGETSYPGRFLEDGSAVISEQAFVAAVHELVSAVAERLGTAGDELLASSVVRLLTGPEEAPIRRGLAALGLDPDADLGDDPALRDALAVALPSLPEPLQRDILDGFALDDLGTEVRWVHDLLRQARAVGTGEGRAFSMPRVAREHPLPHIAGYQRARAARRHMHLEPRGPLTDLPHHIGETFGAVQELELERRPARVGALVTYSGDRSGVVVGSKTGSVQARRFRLARALHHWLYAPGAAQGRLLTQSHSWNQRASRAFAAEFLAPAEGIRERLDAAAGVDADVDLRSLAAEFMVSEQVIQFQAVNHDL